MMVFRTLCVVFLVLTKGCYSQLDVCGKVNLSTKVAGGDNASAGSWPWQVSLQACGKHFCGGSLISRGWVLSAAHCFDRYTASEVTVKLGLYTLEGNNSNSVSINLINVSIPENYSQITYDNDIALLELDLQSSDVFNDYITPVCLAAMESTFFTDSLTWVTGWGDTGVEENLPSPGKLQNVNVSIIGNRQCNCLYGNMAITNNMVCAGSLKGVTDTCPGDSGGPLVIKKDSQWIQVGIVSFGYQCALPDYPGVYTRVSQYQKWISEKTANQPGFINYTSNGTDSDLQEKCITTTSVVCGNATYNNGSGSPWPWLASLQLNGAHVCGGTLIAQQFVLSSADCFSSSINPSDWTVILGRLNQSDSNINEVSVTVTDITLSTNASNNIAVLKLSTTPTLSEFIQPICVDHGNTNFSAGTQCWAAGWGSEGGALQTLQQFKTTIVDCKTVHHFLSHRICIEPIPLKQTESGCPLMCKIGQSWFQAAVLNLRSSSNNSTNIMSTNNSTNSSNSTINSTNSSNTINSTNSSNNTINFNTMSNSINNSSNSIISTNNSTTSSDVYPCSNIQDLTSIASFKAFLNATVGSFPPPATSIITSSGREAFSALSVASILLMSLLALIQTFGSD